MHKDLKILVVVCARGGSKGIPKKNIRLLAGKPVLAYSIEAGLQFDWADKVLVSTDDLAIKAVAEKYGAAVPFLRPKSLANDKVGRIAAVIHALKKSESYYQETYDIVMDLGNMAPLRNQEDMHAAVNLLVNHPETDVVFSVSPSQRNPYYNLGEINSSGFFQVSKKVKPTPSCRQDAPDSFDVNDSIYAIRRDSLLKHKKMTVPIQLVSSLKKRVLIMPQERSVDIDHLIDFQLVEIGRAHV